MDEEKRNKQKFNHKIFKFTILIIVVIFFYLIYSFIKLGFSNKSTNQNLFNFKENYSLYSHLQKKVKNKIKNKSKSKKKLKPK